MNRLILVYNLLLLYIYLPFCTFPMRSQVLHFFWTRVTFQFPHIISAAVTPDMKQWENGVGHSIGSNYHLFRIYSFAAWATKPWGVEAARSQVVSRLAKFEAALCWPWRRDADTAMAG